MTDENKLWFGQYGKPGKEKLLGETPAKYLLWLWNQGLKNEVMMRTKRGNLARYIQNSMDALQMEAPDVIVE